MKALSSVLFLFIALSPQIALGQQSDKSLRQGDWGGRTAIWHIDATGATFTEKCGAVGFVSGAIQVDVDGRFDLSGELRYGMGSQPFDGRFMGQARGNVLSLTVVSTDPLHPYVGCFLVRYGHGLRSYVCPAKGARVVDGDGDSADILGWGPPDIIPVAARNGRVDLVLFVSNSGPSDAENVEVTMSIPANATFRDIEAPDGWGHEVPESGERGSVVFTKRRLRPSHVVVLRLIVRVDKDAPAGVLESAINITSETPDPNPANNAGVISRPLLGPNPRITSAAIRPDPSGGTLLVVRGHGFTSSVAVIIHGHVFELPADVSLDGTQVIQRGSTLYTRETIDELVPHGTRARVSVFNDDGGYDDIWYTRPYQ